MSGSRGSDARRFRRGRRTRQTLSRGLVVCEGTITEVQYVDALKQLAMGSRVMVKGLGKDPLRVVEKTCEIRDRERRDGDPFAWCCSLVDKDVHAKLPQAVELAADEGVHLLVSNPCFELWLLWHLADHYAESTQSQLVKRLEQLGHSGKSLNAAFPSADHLAAQTRALQADPQLATCRIGPNPSSSMPVLLRLMGLSPET